MKNNKSLKVRFLGGIGEIGKNMTVLEYGKDIIIIDAGLTFPSPDMPGIDLVIPDTTYLINNKDRIRGLVLTHGHEDHIGSVPYLIKDVNIPVYGTKMTLTLAESKIKEFNIDNYDFHVVKPRDRVNLGCFQVEFINVNHSISGSCALAVTTPVGVVFHTGDFKIDLTPINGEIIDLSRLSELGKKGVLLMLAESTNVERPGYTMSETVVGKTLDHLFIDNAKRRLIIATFSSNVQRIQQIIDLAAKHKRKVALSGRSMLNVTEAAQSIGELTIPKGILVDIDRIKNIADKDLCIISTGSQGEPMSVLTRMAADDFQQVKITDNDTIIISASPIPGNERSIYQVINNLYKKGAEVVYDSIEKIHVSGHACQEELKIIHSLIKPKFFIPVHGEYRHLKKHISLAKSLGMKDHQMILAELGDTVEVTARTFKKGEKVPSGSRFVDGLSIDDTQTTVRDRVHLGEDGLVIPLCCISSESGEIMQRPDVVVRGVILTNEQLEDIKDVIEKTIGKYDLKAAGDMREVKNKIRSSVRNYIIKKTKNNPMILPLITEV